MLSVCQQVDIILYSTCAQVITVVVLVGLQLKIIFTVDYSVDDFHDKLFGQKIVVSIAHQSRCFGKRLPLDYVGLGQC